MGEPTMKAKDLALVGFMYRAMAASVFNSDKDEYERLEAKADWYYVKAAEQGADFTRVPRLAGEIPAQTVCDQCGAEFLPQRKTARFCSDLCRKQANRRPRA